MSAEPLSLLLLNPLERGAWGGVERWLFDLATELRARGHHVVSAGCPESAWTARAEEAGFPVLRVPLRADFDLTQARNISAFMREHKVSVIGTKLHRGIRVSGFAARFAQTASVNGGRRAKVVAFMGLVETRPGWRYALTYRLFLDRIVTLSDAMRDEIAAAGRLSPELVETIPYGVRPGDYEVLPADGLATRAELGIAPAAPVALALGRMHLQKRFDLMLEAWKEVLKTLPTAQLLIAGQGRMLDLTRALAGSLGIAANVKFLGFRRDVPRLLAASDCLAMSSDFEGLPMVVLEAMAASRAVVTTDTGSVRAMVEEGVTGHVVAIRDTAALARGLTAVLGAPDRGRALGLAGRARVLNRFPLSRCIEETERYLQSLAR